MKILIIKLAAIGDVLRTTAVLLPLKKRYPDADIFWVTGRESKDILANNPYLLAVYSIEEFRIEGKYDLVASLDEDRRAARLASDIGGRIDGFYLKDGRVVPTESAKRWYQMSSLGKKPQNDILKRQNVKTYQEHMLEILGLDAGVSPSRDYPLIYELTGAEKAAALNFRRQNNIKGSDVLVGFNTGSGGRWQHKKWRVDRTYELIARTSRLPGVRSVLFGGPEERRRNARIVKMAADDLIDTGVDNPLRVFASLINACDILVASDSLAMHLAIALKKYVVAFFGPTSSAEIELYEKGAKVLPDMDCLACYKSRCNFKRSCMDAVSSDMLFDALSKGIKILKGG